MLASLNLPSGNSFVNAIDYAVLSHIGQRRGENQDSFSVVIGDTAALFVVADGMGGASGGAQASAIAARIMAMSLTSGADESHQDALKRSIVEANQEIFTRGRRNPSLEGMGTTVSGIVLTTHTVLVCNVGDSRVYRIRDNSIAQLTVDHTLVGELLESGALTPEQAEQSPVSHMLTRSVGPSPEVEIDCYYASEPPLRGDIYLICSDGLFNTISSAEMGYVVGEYRLHDALEHLVGLANMRGGADNISAILIECHVGFPESVSDGVASDRVDSGRAESKGVRKKIVEVDLAEAAASDTFSRVKREVDISAEILWGANSKTTTPRSPQVQSTSPHTAKTQIKLTLIQRAILVSASVFVGTLAWAFWVNQNREVIEPLRPATAAVDRQILDFNRKNQLLEDAERSEGVKSRERRRTLVARLEADVSDIPEIERVERRKKRLLEARGHLESQISAIATPPDPALLELQKKLDGNRDDVRSRLQELEKEIEKIGLSLNRWRQRFAEIDEIDTVNLTSELAQFSPELKDKKEFFEQSTWRYLKRLEDQRFDPANTEIQHDVDQLVQDRNQRLEDLAKSAREFIQAAIGKDARERGLLLIEKDETLQDEKNFLADLEYISVRLSGDQERQKALTLELVDRRLLVERELQELDSLKSSPQSTEPASLLTGVPS